MVVRSLRELYELLDRRLYKTYNAFRNKVFSVAGDDAGVNSLARLSPVSGDVDPMDLLLLS